MAPQSDSIFATIATLTTNDNPPFVACPSWGRRRRAGLSTSRSKSTPAVASQEHTSRLRPSQSPASSSTKSGVHAIPWKWRHPDLICPGQAPSQRRGDRTTPVADPLPHAACRQRKRIDRPGLLTASFGRYIACEAKDRIALSLLSGVFENSSPSFASLDNHRCVFRKALFVQRTYGKNNDNLRCTRAGNSSHSSPAS